MGEAEYVDPSDLSESRKVDRIEGDHPPLAELFSIERTFADLGTKVARFQPIGANCDRTYHARRVSGRRPLHVIDLIVKIIKQRNPFPLVIY